MAALELSHTDYRVVAEAIKGMSNTQTILADVLREHGLAMRSSVEDIIERLGALEERVAELKGLVEPKPG